MGDGLDALLASLLENGWGNDLGAGWVKLWGLVLGVRMVLDLELQWELLLVSEKARQWDASWGCQ